MGAYKGATLVNNNWLDAVKSLARSAETVGLSAPSTSAVLLSPSFLASWASSGVR